MRNCRRRDKIVWWRAKNQRIHIPVNHFFLPNFRCKSASVAGWLDSGAGWVVGNNFTGLADAGWGLLLRAIGCWDARSLVARRTSFHRQAHPFELSVDFQYFDLHYLPDFDNLIGIADKIIG